MLVALQLSIHFEMKREEFSVKSLLHHAKCYCGIEESTAYSVEHPGGDSEGKTKAETDE